MAQKNVNWASFASLGLTLMAGLMLATEAAPPAAETTMPSNCQEWSNGCRLCNRQANGTIVCSTPGIACQPGPTVCHAPDKG